MEKLIVLGLTLGFCCLLLHREGLMPPRGGGRSFVFFLLLLAVGSRWVLMDRISTAAEDAAREAVTYFRQAGGFWGVKSYTGPRGLGVQYLLSLCGLIPRGFSLFRAFCFLSDALLAWGCSRCVGAISVKPGPRVTTFLLVLLLPSGIIESAGGMGVGLRWLFPVLAAAAVLRGRFRLAGLMLGLGITVDPETLWLIPVFWVFSAIRENSGRTIGCLLGAYFVSVIPALLIGRAPEAVFPFYPGFSSFFAKAAAGGAPGLYALSPLAGHAAGIASYAILACLVIYRLSGRDAIRDRRRQYAALCFASLAAGSLLPGMSSAALFGSEALLIALCCLESEAIPAAALVCGASGIAAIREVFPALLSVSFFWASAAVFIALLLLLGLVLFRRR